MTRSRRTGPLAVLTTLLVFVLAACAGLPTSGPVRLGELIEDDGEAPPVVFVPDGPSAGMTAQQVVDGFIAAGSGPRDNWGIAQLFLAPDFRDVWKPAAGVTVYSPGQRTVTAVDEDEVQVTVVPEATVDDTGLYSAGSGSEATLTYRLAQVDGEWRIVEAPDGIVLDRNRFASVYRSYPLMYFDATWTYLVPDLRWFVRENAATRITEALIGGGPSPWLEGSVVTAFSESAGLAQRSVPVRSQVAEVSLRAPARELDQTVLDRMQTQLEQSLAAAGILGVEMLVDGQELAASAVPVRSTNVDARSLVLGEGGFGFLSGDEIERIPGLSDAIEAVAPVAVELDADRAAAAVRLDSGEVRLIRGDETWQTLDQRDGLVDPTIDTRGYVYTVPADAPSELVAYASDGTPHVIADAWPGATQISALRVSRDGTRIAALVRDGTRPAVLVAGILRDADGVPQGLGEVFVLDTNPGDGVDLAWLGETALAVVTLTEGQWRVLEQPIGGPAALTFAPTEVASVAGGNQSGAVRLLDASAELYGQRGAAWLPLASEIAVLAVQQGAPL